MKTSQSQQNKDYGSNSKEIVATKITTAKATQKKIIPYDVIKGKLSNTIVIRTPTIKVEETGDGSLLIRTKF